MINFCYWEISKLVANLLLKITLILEVLHCILELLTLLIWLSHIKGDLFFLLFYAWKAFISFVITWLNLWNYLFNSTQKCSLIRFLIFDNRFKFLDLWFNKLRIVIMGSFLCFSLLAQFQEYFKEGARCNFSLSLLCE